MEDHDINLLVAEKVMGWKRGGKGDHTRPRHFASKDFPGRVIHDFESKGEHDYLACPCQPFCRDRVAFCGCESTVEVPDYTGDQWVSVVETMVRREMSFHLYNNAGGGWSAVFTLKPNFRGAIAGSAQTYAGRAICVAALKASGVEVAQ